MSIQDLSRQLATAGVKHVVVSAASDIAELRKAVADFKKDVLTVSKSRSASDIGKARDAMETGARAVKSAAYALAYPARVVIDLEDLKAFSKDFMSMATSMFPQPTTKQLAGSGHRYYTQASTIRAACRNDAKRIATATDIEEALDFIGDAAMSLVLRDMQLLNLSSEYDF